MVYSGWRLTARQEFERYVSVLNQVKINRKILTDVHSVTQSVTAKIFFLVLKTITNTCTLTCTNTYTLIF